jgi:hypothetical protein
MPIIRSSDSKRVEVGVDDAGIVRSRDDNPLVQDLGTVLDYFCDATGIQAFPKYGDLFFKGEVFATLSELHRSAQLKRMASFFCDRCIRLIVDRCLWMLVRVWHQVSHPEYSSHSEKVKLLMTPIVGSELASSICRGVCDGMPNYMQMYSKGDIRFGGSLSAMAKALAIIIREGSVATIKEMLCIIKMFNASVLPTMNEILMMFDLEDEFRGRSPLRCPLSRRPVESVSLTFSDAFDAGSGDVRT